MIAFTLCREEPLFYKSKIPTAYALGDQWSEAAAYTFATGATGSVFGLATDLVGESAIRSPNARAEIARAVVGGFGALVHNFTTSPMEPSTPPSPEFSNPGVPDNIVVFELSKNTPNRWQDSTNDATLDQCWRFYE